MIINSIRCGEDEVENVLEQSYDSEGPVQKKKFQLHAPLFFSICPCSKIKFINFLSNSNSVPFLL
jgi:hypothetical protein